MPQRGTRPGTPSPGTARPRFVRVSNLLRQTDEGAALLHELHDHVIRHERRFVRGKVWDPGSAKGVVNERIRRVVTLKELGQFEAVITERIRRHLPDVMPRGGCATREGVQAGDTVAAPGFDRLLSEPHGTRSTAGARTLTCIRRRPVHDHGVDSPPPDVRALTVWRGVWDDFRTWLVTSA